MTNERTRRLDLGTFLDRATRIHGDTYLYDKAVVYGSRSRVTITCRTHGDFIQRADGHLEGKGCILCGHKKKASRSPDTKDAFIAKARSIHGDTYDYSLVEYKRSTEKVTIVCRKHGRFDIRADVHTWQKSGCPSCAQEVRTIKQSGDTLSFVAKAKALHGDRYDYSKVNYSRSGKKVTITCCEHGDFSVTPNKHITDGQGCPECSKKQAADSRRLTIDAFIEIASSVHSGKYTYDSSDYVNAKTAVLVGCPEHGDFWITPDKHIYSAQGCPLCAPTSRGEVAIAAYLDGKGIDYIRQATFDGLKSKRLLRFDFFLPNYDTAIEYHGMQHYQPIDFFGGEDGFLSRKQSDNAKLEWMNANGYNLIIVPYTVSPDIVGQHLDSILSGEVPNDRN